jgi:cytidine deaminase
VRDEDRQQIDLVVAAAKDVRQRAYAPYSAFKVGAAVLAGGRVFAGVNVENASYGLTMCAERSAVFGAVAAGERTIDCVAVVTDEGRPTPPCGACRQVLWEFGRSALVVAESNTSGERVMWTLDDLIPDAFGPDDLR